MSDHRPADLKNAKGAVGIVRSENAQGRPDENLQAGRVLRLRTCQHALLAGKCCLCMTNQEER